MPAPTHVRDLATACVTSVKAVLDFELDYGTETLPLLDHYVRQLFTGDEESPKDEMILTLIAPMCGAYFGEVASRRFQTLRWHAPVDEHPQWRLEGERIFLYFNPIGLALEVITEAEAPGWGGHVEIRPEDSPAVKHAVELFGVVREADYYSFAMRFETLEQIFEAIVREAQVHGDLEKKFSSALYAQKIADKRAEQ